jgi:hypothetical protein
MSHVDDALDHATHALAISVLLVGLGLSVIEYLLLSIRCFDSKVKPTNGELTFLVTAFWFLLYLFDLAFSKIIDAIISFFATAEVVAVYVDIRHQIFTVEKALAISPAILLLGEIVTTWAIHLLLVVIFDAVIPFILSLLRDYRGTFFGLRSRFEHRCNELAQFTAEFIYMNGMAILVDREWIIHRFQFMRPCFDICKFERCYSAGGGKKEFCFLTWNITVSQEALKEVMEVLKTIGDFGELGFHTSGNKVSFEATGSGSTVNLVIEMGGHGLEVTRADEHPDSAPANTAGGADAGSMV